jgi:hypothetical protein
MINKIKSVLKTEYEDPIGVFQFSIYYVDYMILEKIGPRAGCLGILGIMIFSNMMIPGCAPLV